MSADQLRRAATKLRDDRIPAGPWTFGQVDPRPNWLLLGPGSNIRAILRGDNHVDA